MLRSYRRWKEEGAELKARAQNLLVERFHELVREAQQVQHDLFEDFGQAVKFPVNPKFAKKGKSRPAAKKAAALATPSSVNSPLVARASGAEAPAVRKPSGPPSTLRVNPPEKTARAVAARPSRSGKQTTGQATGANELEHLARQVEKARQRLEEARKSGGPVKIQNAEDRLYELSDELRLLTARQAE